MSVRTDVVSLFEQVAAQQKKKLAPLLDELVLLDSGLDSLCLAIIVALYRARQTTHVEDISALKF